VAANETVNSCDACVGGGIGPDELRVMLLGGWKRLEQERRRIDEMNVFPVPDGDTGTNMSMTFEKAVSGLSRVYPDVGELTGAVARGALLGARGNSGVILSQILKGFSDGLREGARVNPSSFARALESGADRAYQAVIKPVEGTILTVMRDAAKAAVLASAAKDSTVEEVLRVALDQAGRTLKRTPQMLEKLRQAGVVDAGGMGLFYMLEGMLLALRGELEVEPLKTETAAMGTVRKLPFQYCTEVVIAADHSKADRIRSELARDSDSLLVVGDDGRIKVHVHTNDPGGVISYSLGEGELLDIKVDNMAYRHNDKFSSLDESIRGADVGVSVVAVVAGSGLAEIFRSLGAAVIVEGGPGMNPSAEELAEAVKRAPGRRVILLPNDDNIRLAAGRAAELSGKEVGVVPTSNIPEGFAAMMEFDPDGDADECVERMKEAAKNISVAEIARAVRDSAADGVAVRRGEYIAIVDGRIKSSARTIEQIFEDAVGMFITGGHEVISVYWGVEMCEDSVKKMIDRARMKHSGIGFEAHYGGQPHYPLLICGE